MKYERARRGFGKLGQDADYRVDPPDLGHVDGLAAPRPAPRQAPPAARSTAWVTARRSLAELVDYVSPAASPFFSYSGSLRVAVQLFEAHLPEWANAQAAVDTCHQLHAAAMHHGDGALLLIADHARDLIGAWMRSIGEAPRPLSRAT